MRKGVRQRCPLSPRLFNVYAEEITWHKFSKKCGFKINGERLNEISYADGAHSGNATTTTDNGNKAR